MRKKIFGIPDLIFRIIVALFVGVFILAVAGWVAAFIFTVLLLHLYLRRITLVVISKGYLKLIPLDIFRRKMTVLNEQNNRLVLHHQPAYKAISDDSITVRAGEEDIKYKLTLGRGYIESLYLYLRDYGYNIKSTGTGALMWNP